MSLESLVEKRFLEIEERVRGRNAKPRNAKPTTNQYQIANISYADEQIDRYEYRLNEIMRNVREARADAPCAGCKKTIQTIKITTLGALTALAVYKAMTSENRNRANFGDEEIQRIKEQVELKYANY